MRFAKLAAAILLASFPFAARLPAEEKKTKEDKQTLALNGSDPRGFADAKEMLLRPAPARAARAGDKIVELSALLSSRRLPEANDTTMAILRSAGSLTDAEYSRLRALAMDTGRTIKRNRMVPLKAKERFAAGNRLYEKGDLAGATKEYAAALRIAPDYLDARNNLALAEMHLGYDVSAAFHFRLIQALDPKYLGARMNLSVALARLGLWQEAYATSRFVARDMPKGPIAQYNLAWFHNARGDYAGTAKSVALALDAFHDYDKARRLQVLNETEAGREAPSESIASLSSSERSRLSSLERPKVIVAAGATLRDRDRVAGTARTARQCLLSERQQPWIAVYWPDDTLKHRLWLHEDEMKAGLVTALSGTWQLKRDGKPWATASFRQVNGALRGGVQTMQADPKLHFDIDSVALDGNSAKMKIRYRSGERATLNLALADDLRKMTGRTLPSYAEVVAEKIRD
jgi:tetratricopeptide (TPR) repeat protein